MLFITCIAWISVLTLVSGQTPDFSFPTEDGSKSNWNCKGKCIPALQCEVALNTVKYSGFRPKTCFFYVKEHYICCPVKGLNGTVEGTFLGQRLSDKSE